MNMEKDFREALQRVLKDGTFKNARTLCLAADVDPAGLSRFLSTMDYDGQGDPPKMNKGNLALQTVSKLVDVMGGFLVFPWNGNDACSRNFMTAKSENAQLQADMKLLEKTNAQLEGQVSILKELLRESQHALRDAEIQLQAKSHMANQAHLPEKPFMTTEDGKNHVSAGETENVA